MPAQWNKPRVHFRRDRAGKRARRRIGGPEARMGRQLNGSTIYQQRSSIYNKFGGYRGALAAGY